VAVQEHLHPKLANQRLALGAGRGDHPRAPCPGQLHQQAADPTSGAARIIEGFGARLRDQVDLDTLTTDLLAVVDQTIQPTQASLWRRTPPEPSRTPPDALASR
jgi:hypothetical protein